MPFDTNRPFLLETARAAGVTPNELRGPRFRMLFRGVYISARIRARPVHQVQGALLLFAPDRAHASHDSAARVLGIPVPDHPDVHVTVHDPNLRRRRPGIRCHVRRASRVVTRDGIWVTEPHELFVELASQLGLVDLVVAGDHMVRDRLTTPEQLVEFCRDTELPHASKARRAAQLVRRGVDSPMETRARLLLVLAGLPEPELNAEISAGDGTLLRRHDMVYRQGRVAIEYDGRHHIDRQDKWSADLHRREASEDDGWRFIVLTAADIFKTPDQTVQRVFRILRQRGVPGLPARPSQDWRLHFPGR